MPGRSGARRHSKPASQQSQPEATGGSSCPEHPALAPRSPTRRRPPSRQGWAGDGDGGVPNCVKRASPSSPSDSGWLTRTSRGREPRCWPTYPVRLEPKQALSLSVSPSSLSHLLSSHRQSRPAPLHPAPYSARAHLRVSPTRRRIHYLPVISLRRSCRAHAVPYPCQRCQRWQRPALCGARIRGVFAPAVTTHPRVTHDALQRPMHGLARRLSIPPAHASPPPRCPVGASRASPT